jgi:DNA-binding transcriptional LysR family regulator
MAHLSDIGRAEQELNTVQSNATAGVRLLERELGTQLFE